MTTSSPPRSLYVHVPFCLSRCAYCDFHSEEFDPAQVSPLVDALLAELDHISAALPLTCDTVYVGGGTPSVLPDPLLKRLLRRLRACTSPTNDVEFTVEANPATVSRRTADLLVANGVTRVSIGAQSFHAQELRTLGRAHNPAQITDTVFTCWHAGVRQINLDLIFGIPGQTRASWQRSLEAALALNPDHISCYGLTYEERTPLRQQRDAGLLQPVDEETEAQMYELMLDVLPAAGLRQYELSNFARPGAECRHNLGTWRNEPYVGIGPSAAGYVDHVRYRNVPDTRAYIAALNAGTSPRTDEEQLELPQQMGETAMLALRTTAGIDRATFTKRYGVDPATHFATAIARHRPRGLLHVDEQRICLTRAGMLLANMVMADFL